MPVELTGARRNAASGTRLAVFAGAAVCALVVNLTSACAGDDSESFLLMDDSEPPELTVELEGARKPAVLTKVRTIEASAIEPVSRSSSCLREQDLDPHAVGVIVERMGLLGESVTVWDASGPALHACDNSLGRRERDLRWCGGAYGRLHGGRLTDPRLSVACETRDRRPMGFAWIDASPETRYVAVIDPDYTEVYMVAGNLPVRVATASEARIEGSRVTFEISEHDATGGLLRKYALEAAVAG